MLEKQQNKTIILDTKYAESEINKQNNSFNFNKGITRDSIRKFNNFHKYDDQSHEISIPEELKISIDSFGGLSNVNNPENNSSSTNTSEIRQLNWNKNISSNISANTKIVIPKIKNFNIDDKEDILYANASKLNEKNNCVENYTYDIHKINNNFNNNFNNTLLEKTATFFNNNNESNTATDSNNTNNINITNNTNYSPNIQRRKPNTITNKLKNKANESEINQSCFTTRDNKETRDIKDNTRDIKENKEFKEFKGIINSKYQIIKNDSNALKVAKLSNKIESKAIKPPQLKIAIPSVAHHPVQSIPQSNVKKATTGKLNTNKPNTSRGLSAKQVKNPTYLKAKPGKDLNIELNNIVNTFTTENLTNQPFIVEKLDHIIDNLTEIKKAISVNNITKKNIERSKSGILLVNIKKSSPTSANTISKSIKTSKR